MLLTARVLVNHSQSINAINMLTTTTGSKYEILFIHYTPKSRTKAIDRLLQRQQHLECCGISCGMTHFTDLNHFQRTLVEFL
jgi:hypothetical protein